MPEYFDNRGLSYAKNGEYDRAIIDFTQAIRIAPQAKFLTNRGNAWQSKGDLGHAIADYDRAIRIDPTDADAGNNRGTAWRGKGDIDRAMADYREALRIKPKFDTAAESLESLRLLRAKNGKRRESASMARGRRKLDRNDYGGTCEEKINA